jgi:uncharacterized membrane protein
VKAALVGAFVCGLLGPSAALVAFFISDLANITVSDFDMLPLMFVCAVVLVGPGAFVLGGAGAFVIQFMSARVHSTKVLFLQVAALGLLFGATVPSTALGGDKKFATELVPLGAGSGLGCAAVVFWLLHRMRLLCVQQPHSPEAV